MEQIKITYDELNTFSFPMDEKFSLTVMFENKEYGFIAHFKYDGKIISLNCENKENIPDEKVNASIIWYNVDIAKDMACVGCIGNENEYYLKNIRDIILKLAKRVHLNNEDLLFYGSSTGAFTSLQLAAMIKGSTAIAIRPLLFLKNHPEFDEIVQNTFPQMSRNEVMVKYQHRFDVMNMIIKEDHIPKSILIFDFDEQKINTQYSEFIKNINQFKQISNNENRIKIVLSNEFNTDKQIELLNGAISKNLMCYVNELEDSDIYKQNLDFKKDNEELTEIMLKWGKDFSNKIEMEMEINKLTKENQIKDKIITDLNKQLEGKQKEMDELLFSKSWKMTKPLRKGMNFLKK